MFAVLTRPKPSRTLLAMDASGPIVFRTRHCKVLVVPGAFSLDVFGPLEVFAMGDSLWRQRCDSGAAARAGAPSRGSREAAYSVELISEHGGAVPSSSDVPLVTARSTHQVTRPFDTLIVAGGPGVAAAMESTSMQAEVKRLSGLCRRVTSVCTGAFLLAAAGLLSGRRATTHWASCDALSQQFSDVLVERAPIYTRDGNIYTSAGATAGMDLALALVRDDLGSAVALEIARWLVLFVQRPAGHAQLSAALQLQSSQRRPLRDLQVWIADHPDADLRVSQLAHRVGMSPRNFARAFSRELGVTPASYVEQVRMEAASRHLAFTDDCLEHVAVDCGFGTVETLRRTFKRTLGVGPADYRKRCRRREGGQLRHS